MSDDILKLVMEFDNRSVLRSVGEVGEKLEDAGEKAEKVGEKTKEASAKSVTAWGVVSGATAGMAASYNHIVSALSDITGRIDSFATRITDLAAEQGRLTAQSRAMGLNFDHAADAAGRFVDETDTLGAASQFAARDIRLTQGELDALARVAGHASQELGITAGEGVQRLTEAMIRGNERGLAPFGAELVATAGHTHTMSERLAALVEHARDVAPATDTAADAMARFKDTIEDMQRAAATAFTDELTRLAQITSGTRDAATAADEWNTNIAAVGHTAAFVLTAAFNGIGVVIGGVATAISGLLSGIGALGAGVQALTVGGGRDVLGAMRRSLRDSETTGTLGDFTLARARAFGRLMDDANQRTTAGERTSEPARRTGADMVITAAEAADDARNADARNRHGGGGGARAPRDRRDTAADAIQAARAENQRSAAYRAQATTALDALTANDNAIADKADASTGANSGNASERYDAFASDRNADRIVERERRSFEDRYEAARTFTERWTDLHRQQLDATRELATGSQAAFQSAGAAYSKHLDLVRKGEETFGDALRNGAADILGAIGERMGARAGEEFAEGLASLASPITLPFAPLHFAAAAAFTAGAVGFGAASSAVHTSAPAAGAGGGAPQRPLGLGASNDNARGGVTNVTINYGSSGLIMGTPREVAEHLGRIVNDPTADFVLSGARVAGGRR